MTYITDEVAKRYIYGNIDTGCVETQLKMNDEFH
jgi:hypothetical protein